MASPSTPESTPQNEVRPIHTTTSDGLGERPPKRHRVINGESHASGHQGPRRRQAACQPCRLRKIKCDKQKPYCGFCRSSGSPCEYQEKPSDSLTLEGATETLLGKLDHLQRDIDILKRAVCGRDEAPRETEPDTWMRASPHAAGRIMQTASTIESSRDFLQIPPHRASADAVLEWEIFRGKYPGDALIGVLFQPRDESVSSPASIADGVMTGTGLHPPDDEKIPSLIDSFLQNVHTKNPLLDAELLVKHGRRCAEHGVGWDALSCLVLLACALGTVAKPFGTSITQQPVLPRGTVDLAPSSASCSAHVYAKELQQAESCFALACRRLGSLKHTLLGAQCYFFAGVYLMYTLRPILSWQYFIHASVLYQLYRKTTHSVPESHTHVPSEPLTAAESKTRRLEQSLYWSCFKSECEFRVELPFPQSEISAGECPDLFPSPPSPHETDVAGIPTSNPLDRGSVGGRQVSLTPLGHFDAQAHITDEEQELRQHAKNLCNEEESWYYYLTEIALRRIGNRIINTFFRQHRSSWLNIKPLLRMAQEFEAQVSSWSAHLPPAMQHYETTSIIRAPHLNSHSQGAGSHVSRELSWAVDNRLLEMQTWLYQPFLYYLIHVGLGLPSTTSGSYPYHATAIPDQRTRDGHLSNLLNPFLPVAHSTADSHVLGLADNAAVADGGSPLDNEDLAVLRSLIASGIECNLKTLEVRSIGHRHHGLWYDLRSIMCSSLTLLAVVKSGNAAWIPGGAEALWGSNPGASYWTDLPVPIGGRIAKVLAQFSFWAAEAPDLLRYREILEEVVRDVRGS